MENIEDKCSLGLATDSTVLSSVTVNKSTESSTNCKQEVQSRSDIITIEDSPESPEPEIIVDAKGKDVITIDDTPESPPGEVQFLGSLSGNRTMKVRVETDDEKNEGVGFVIDRDGLLPNPCYNPDKDEDKNPPEDDRHARAQLSKDGTIPVYDVESHGIITVDIDSESDEEHPGGLCKKMQKQGKNGPKCFNCGGMHMINDCPDPKDSRRIYRNIKLFRSRSDNQGKNCRYHEDADQKYSHFKPGEMSDSLRYALGLDGRQLAKHIYNMRAHGYPPGWKEYAMHQQATLKLYGSTVVGGDSPSDTVSASRVYNYPGFNCPVPDGFIDESRKFSKPAYSLKYTRDKLIRELSDELSRRQRQKRESENKCSYSSYVNSLLRKEDSTSSHRHQPTKRREDDQLQRDLNSNKRRRLSSEQFGSDKPNYHQHEYDHRKQTINDGAIPSSSRQMGSSWVDGHGREVVMENVSVRPEYTSYSSKRNDNFSINSGDETSRYNLKPTPGSSRRICEKSERFESDHSRPSKRTCPSSVSNQGTRDFKDKGHKDNYRRGDCKRSRTSGREDSTKGRNRRRIRSADGDGDTNLKGYNIKGTLTPKWNESQLTVNPGSWLGIEYRKKLAKEQEASTKKTQTGDNEKTLPKVSAAFTHQARTPSPSLLQNLYSSSEQLNTNDDDVVVLSTSLAPPKSPESSFVSRHRIRYRKKRTNKKNENWEVESDPGQMSHKSSDSSETDEEVAIIASIPGQEKINVEQDKSARSKNYSLDAATSQAINIVDSDDDDDDEFCLTIDESELVVIDDGDEDCDSCDKKTRKCGDDGVNTVGSNSDGDCQNKSLDLFTAKTGEAKAQASATILLNKTESLNQDAARQEIVQGDDGKGENLKKLPDVYIYKNCYEDLPSLDKFAVGMSDLLLHETDEDHVGRFEKVLSILSKRKIK